MRVDVLIQIGFLAKLFPTTRLHTEVRPLSAVNEQVLVEDGTLSEGPEADGAGERLLVGMDAEVLIQMRLLTKRLPALRATVRARVRVDPLVLLENCFLFEVLPTSRTLEQTQG